MTQRSLALADWKATRKQKKLIKEVLKSGRLTYGDKTRELERRFAEIHGAKHAIFTSSGTAALKISLHALKDKHGWKDGSEVIIPSVTFVATMNAVLMNNLKPVLVDVELNTANINPHKITSAITKKTVAIMPVHLLGQPSTMAEIMKIAKNYRLEVVEDSCETMFVNKLEGTTACFSTYVAHLLVTGVGGFILTNDDKLATTMRSMLFHGRDESYLNIDDKPKEIWRRFYFPRHGYSDRMTELEAAIGLGDLDHWQDMIDKRQENADYLRSNLSPIWRSDALGADAITFPHNISSNHSYMFFPAYTHKRDELMIYLEKNGIQTRTMMPLISQPITKPYLKGKYPVAKYIEEHGILLPCHQYLKKKDLDYLINTIKEFYT
jgi:perosamine synthetase